MAGLKRKYLFGLLGVGVFGVLALAKCGMDSGIIPTPVALKALVPQKTSIPLADVSAGTPRLSYDLQATPASMSGCVKVLTIPWNGEGALNLANGDARTTADSLVKKYSGGCLAIERQDDYGNMRDEMVKFAQALANGEKNPTEGAAFTVIMGDGGPAFFQALQPRLAKFHQSAVVVDVLGFSYGEDKCMGKDLGGDPQKAKGAVIAAVPADGDWNICVKFASDNGIKINTNSKVYDHQAINFVDTNSFTEADDRYIAGYCETRDEANNGLKTGKKVQACVDGVATWTPGDVTVVQKKGNRSLVTWASTREYNQQMPAVLIGNSQWMAANRDFVVGLLRAIDRASFQIRSPGNGLQKMATVNAAVFGAQGGDEASPAYWAKYYVGESTVDGLGNKVYLGGSRSSTLAEARDYFGLGQGSFNVYKGVYTVFGDYDKTFEPSIAPDYPAYDTVVDTSYVQAALQGVQMSGSTQTSTEFKPGAITDVVSSRAVSIEFDTGKATIRPSSKAQLQEIANQVGMTNLRVQINGHTDNTGNSDANLTLSQERAQAVADYLTSLSAQAFPASRMTVRGYGDTRPVDGYDPNSAEGRAHNRRVEIILGK